MNLPDFCAGNGNSILWVAFWEVIYQLNTYLFEVDDGILVLETDDDVPGLLDD